MRAHRVLTAMVALAACSDGAGVPAMRVPTSVVFVGAPPASLPVGAEFAPVVVRVTDADGPISGVLVNLAVAMGGGRVTPRADTTKLDGTVTATLTLGTAPGQNDVSAVVAGLSPARSPAVLGVAGPVDTLTMATRAVRLSPGQDSIVIAVVARDRFLNATGVPVAWVSRNPGLVSVAAGVASAGVVRAVTRPGQTYVVASAGPVIDSVRVGVLDAASSPCSFAADPLALDVGAVRPFEPSGITCVRAEESGAEYALVAHYNTPTAGTSATMDVLANGIVAPAAVFPSAPSDQEPESAGSFELGLRQRERAEMATRMAGARAWFAAPSRRPAVTAPLREGDIVPFNVNAFEFCANPDFHGARVVAVTTGAIIMADTANPTGGFTDDEYRSLGVTMDTLVIPVDTAAFGAPADIDGNGRVVVLFTRAVNELTPRGFGGGIALGFHYSRDLLPRQGGGGECPGSNVSEMFYLLVPDPNGEAADARSKTFVQNVAVATIAHEYQHLVNASRRMYVTGAAEVTEEVWLNEGLSHIAEELVFYRASNLSPRQNIGAVQLGIGSSTRLAFDTYQRENVARYRQYLRATDSNSPLAPNDAIATRGATWAFLRYVADRARLTDGDFWRSLVNGRLTGSLNLDAALAASAMTTLGALRDWSVSVITDDNPSTALFQQQSWNFIAALPAAGLSYTLVPSVLANATPTVTTLRSAGSAYLRFAVPEHQEALLVVTGPGGASLPSGVRLTIVRIR